MVTAVAAPAEAGLPGRQAALSMGKAAVVPSTGIPVFILHGPISTRGALGIVSDYVLVRPLAPLMPSTRLLRADIVDISIESGHWYAFGRNVVCIRRAKGPAIRLMAAGASDGTESLGRLLRAWWRASSR